VGQRRQHSVKCRSSSGSLAKFAAMRRASSLVSRLVAEQRCGAPRCPQVGDKRKSLGHARNDLNDPKRRFATVNYRIAKGSFDYLVSVATADRRDARPCSGNVTDFRSIPIPNRNPPGRNRGSYFRRGALLLLAALLAG
jgi:hypothetical protein